MLYLKNNDEIIESYYILFKDKDLSKKFKLSTYKSSNLIVSAKVLEACSSGYVIQKQNIVNLSFFNDDKIKNNINEILESNLSSDIKKYLLTKVEDFKDYIYFAELFKDKIILEKYYEYKISELLKIKELCQQNKIKSDADNILDIASYAEENSKVLQLTSRINKL